MGGYTKKGPSKKSKKARKKFGKLSSLAIPRGRDAKTRRMIFSF